MGYFLLQYCPKAQVQHYIGFFLCNSVPGVFSSSTLPGASRTTLHMAFLVQCCPRSIKTSLYRSFSCTLLPGASQTKLHRVFLIQYCLRIIQITLHRILFFAMLCGASRTTLHKILTCARLS